MPTYSVGREDRDAYERFFDALDLVRQRHRRRVVDRPHDLPSIRCATYSTFGAVATSERLYSRSSRSRMISMCSRPRKPHRNPKPSAPDVSGLVGERRVVEPESLQRLAQIGVLVAVDGIEPAEHHRLRLAVTLERLGAPGALGDRLADLRLADILDARDQVADLAGPERARPASAPGAARRPLRRRGRPARSRSASARRCAACR